jgi:hypothetical protein
MIHPTPPAMATAVKPMVNETLAPPMIRLSMSLPMESVPRKCFSLPPLTQKGGMFVALKLYFVGLWGVIKFPNSPVKIKTIKMIIGIVGAPLTNESKILGTFFTRFSNIDGFSSIFSNDFSY